MHTCVRTLFRKNTVENHDGAGFSKGKRIGCAIRGWMKEAGKKKTTGIGEARLICATRGGKGEIKKKKEKKKKKITNDYIN